ncbi:MAG: hypothetical protein RI554_08000 [Trueperaceae bacterium]|nr:hypothetical protein [Trueperaceae bacterium]
MNVFELFASIEVDDQGYIRALDNLERKTERSSREMQSTFSRRLGRMQTSLNRFGESAQRFGGVLSRRVTAPIAAAGTAALVAADRTSRAADAIDKGSQSAGLSAERYQTLRFAFEQSGITAEQFDLSLQSLNRRLGLAAQGNRTYADAYERLGVATRDANGELRSAGDVFDDLVVALGNMDSSAEQAATASIVFGDDVGKRLVPVLNQGVDGLADLERQARNAGVVLSGESVDALVQYRDEMNVARRAIGNAAAEVVVAFLPALQDIVQVVRDRVVPAVDNFAGRVESLIGWFSSLSSETQSFVMYVVTAFAVGGPLLVAVAQVTTAFSNLLGVVRLLPAAVAVLTGPAGALTALAVLLGGALYRSLTTHDRQMQNYRTTVEDVANTVGTANDKASLRGRLDELASFLPDEEQNGWKEWANTAITNADRVIDAQREVLRSIAVQLAAEDIREIERREDALRRTNDELARYSEIQLWAAESYLNVRNDLEQAEAAVPLDVDPDDVAEVQYLRGELQEMLDLLDQANLTEREVNMQIAPLLVNRDRFQQDLDNLNADVDAVIDGFMARFDEAGSDGVDVDVETVPDAQAGGTDDDPTGLRALEDEPIDVTVRPQVGGEQAVPLPNPVAGLPTREPTDTAAFGEDAMTEDLRRANAERLSIEREASRRRLQAYTAFLNERAATADAHWARQRRERERHLRIEAIQDRNAVQRQREYQESRLAAQRQANNAAVQAERDAATRRANAYLGFLNQRAQAAQQYEAQLARERQILQSSASFAQSVTGNFQSLFSTFSQQLQEAVSSMVTGVGVSMKNLAQVISSGVVAFVSGVGEMIGAAMAGESGIVESFGQIVLGLVNQLAQMVLAITITASVMMGQIWNPWLMAAGAAGVAAASAGMAMLRSMGASTSGSGDVSGGGYEEGGGPPRVARDEEGNAQISESGVVFEGVTAEPGSIAFLQQQNQALRNLYNTTDDPKERQLALDMIETNEKKMERIRNEGEEEEPVGRVEELRQEIRDLEAQRDAATDEDEIRRLNQEIARKRKELNRLLGLGTSDPAPTQPTTPPPTSSAPPPPPAQDEPDLVYSEQEALEDARTNFGAAGQSVQLAVATPLIQAAEKFQQAADTLTGGVGTNIYQTHAMAMQNHATWLQRMIEEGFNIKLATENEQIEVSLPRYI